MLIAKFYQFRMYLMICIHIVVGILQMHDDDVCVYCKNHCNVQSLVQAAHRYCSDSTFYPLWNSKMSISFGVELSNTKW